MGVPVGVVTVGKDRDEQGGMAGVFPSQMKPEATGLSQARQFRTYQKGAV